MNYDVSSESLSVRVLEFEGTHEVPIDLDFSLPDYCPDIQKILKCQVYPNITARNISGDRLNIEGVANIRIIYIDSDNMKIRCCENSAPFSSSIDIKGNPENAVALTNTRVDYTNCRAVSPRKIDIHGALSIGIKIYSKSSKDISCCVNGKDIQQRTKNTTASNLISINQQQFSLNEILEPSDSKSNPEIIIRSNVSLILNDYKTMQNKIVVKGEVILKILYIDDISTCHLETLEYNIPISQIVDVPGANENGKYLINGEVLSHDVTIHQENENRKNMINAEIKMAATVTAYNDKEIGVVSDIYSVDYDVKTEKTNLELSSLEDILNENFTHKDSVEVSGVNISKIIDIWSENCSLKSSHTNNKLEMNGKTNICILGIDTENTPFYIERIIDFKHKKEWENSSENIIPEISIFPTSIGHNISKENMVDIKINFNISGAIYESQKSKMVTSAETDESRPANKDNSASLTIYYASEGEPIWDIAKKYYTSVNSIKKENNISEDTVQSSGMMLIPMK